MAPSQQVEVSPERKCLSLKDEGRVTYSQWPAAAEIQEAGGSLLDILVLRTSNGPSPGFVLRLKCKVLLGSQCTCFLWPRQTADSVEAVTVPEASLRARCRLGHPPSQAAGGARHPLAASLRSLPLSSHGFSPCVRVSFPSLLSYRGLVAGSRATPIQDLMLRSLNAPAKTFFPKKAPVPSSSWTYLLRPPPHPPQRLL